MSTITRKLGPLHISLSMLLHSRNTLSEDEHMGFTTVTRKLGPPRVYLSMLLHSSNTLSEDEHVSVSTVTRKLVPPLYPYPCHFIVVTL